MFKINEIVWDTSVKEWAQISNGIPEKDGLVPTEARAFRVLGFEKGRAVVGWTYRKVLVNDLRKLTVPEGTPFKYDALNQPQRQSKFFVGRI